MSRIVYVNGEYLPEEDAKISVFDRGFLMADAVYEVTSVIGGKFIDYPAHAARLHRSLGELKMKAPCSDDELLAIHREVATRNDLTDGMIYLQVTRGAADRDFVWPEDAAPGLVLFTQVKDLTSNAAADKGMRVLTVEDQRWGRRDIKTTQLLFPSYAKMEAKAQGADDAWLVTEGLVNEGSSNNAYIVKDGAIITRHLGNEILAGCTRATVLKVAADLQMKVEERPFSVDEAKAADEAFITSASTFVMPVVEIDGAPIGDGSPGAIARRLRETYIELAKATAI